jgi:hypothetical protein
MACYRPIVSGALTGSVVRVRLDLSN